MTDKFASDAKNTSSITGILLAIFVTVSFIVGYWGFCWYKAHAGFGFEKVQKVAVLFKNANGLNEDANVYMDGVRVGAVDKIEWLGAQDVLLRLRITNKKAKLYKSAKFSILNTGLIGSKYVDISMPPVNSTNAELNEVLDDNSVVIGEIPVRTELAMNKVMGLISDFDSSKAKSQWTSDRKTIVRAADKISLLADKTIPLVERTIPFENQLSNLSKELHKTAKRLNDLLGNDHLSADLKETVQQAKETTENMQSAIHELNSTLTDKPLRKDIITAFSNLNQATAHIENSMNALQDTANNQSLRADIKQILADARRAMEKLDDAMNSTATDSDLKSTLHTARETIDNINLAAKQINQILDKRHPLIHMFIGRPGHIDSSDIGSP